jgi:fatty acid desaturase (delta-4 desaturase)
MPAGDIPASIGKYAGHNPVWDPPLTKKGETARADGFELAKTQGKLVTTIDGVTYDITEFMKKHPGGEDMLMLAVGRDATVMVHSYHRDMSRVKKYLKSLPTLGKAPTSAGPGVGQGNIESPVYNELKRRVNAYFEKAGKSSTGDWFMLTKSLVLLGLINLAWYGMVFERLYVCVPFFGVMLAMLGLCIQHDANHGAFSGNKHINQFFGLVDDLIGGSSLMWRHQHVIAHHAHPNDYEMDGDTFSHFPLMRMNPALPPAWYHRFQHIYGPIVYSLIGMAYPITDITEFIKGRHEHVRLQPLRPYDWAVFILGKLISYAWMLFVPMYVQGISALWTIYIPLQLAGGWYLACSFAVSHNTSAADYNVPRDADWAEIQILTGCNWGVDNDWWWLACGGLNYQIEHHLFPGVAHQHYPAISKIVRDVCAERGLRYNSYHTFRSIFAAHREHLRILGTAPAVDPKRA